MTTLRDLPHGTRCLVDVAAMERDGLGQGVCECAEAERKATQRKRLRFLAEQSVVVIRDQLVLLGCCKAVYEAKCDEVSVGCYTGQDGSVGFLVRRKYLLPLPEHGGETDGR